MAERDAGQPELALSTFLHGEQLAKIIDPDDLDETRGGAFYGNIGRCLQFMGQVDSALVCYQKSALMVERDPTNEHIFNQGYIRAWIGELLVAREQAKLAAVFYRAAAAKWRQVYPLKATRMAELARQLEGRFEGRDKSNDATAERVCLDWILGRDIDSEYR